MSRLRQILPHPWISICIFALWMFLATSMSTGQAVLGGALALIVPWLTHPFWPDPPRLRHPFTALALFIRVMIDIVTANIEVARRVLGPIGNLKPAWVDIPLDIDDPFVATILGSIITLTPGTLTCDVDMDGRRLLVHFLNVDDEAAAIADIKSRYEAPLKKVFQC